MDDRQRTAHHEAAHALTALMGGMGLSDGIDLDALTSVQGATGNVGAKLFVPDANDPTAEQLSLLMWNLAVICAGAVSDAKIEGRELRAALEAQPGDYAIARSHALTHPLVEMGVAEDGLEATLDVVINAALQKVAHFINRPDVWDAVSAIADACLANGGKLGVSEIEAVQRPSA